jgi:hypothetical protein
MNVFISLLAKDCIAAIGPAFDDLTTFGVFPSLISFYILALLTQSYPALALPLVTTSARQITSNSGRAW